MSSEKLMFFAFVLIFIGIALLIISSILSLNEKGKTKTELAFGGFIGPVPIGFFSSKQAFWMWIVLTIAAVILFIIFKS